MLDDTRSAQIFTVPQTFQCLKQENKVSTLKTKHLTEAPNSRRYNENKAYYYTKDLNLNRLFCLFGHKSCIFFNLRGKEFDNTQMSYFIHTTKVLKVEMDQLLHRTNGHSSNSFIIYMN